MRKLLEKIIQSDESHGRFLNTLSFLEYVGARKIIKSQYQSELTLELLAHAEEELRHAMVLKRAALKYAPKLCRTYALDALFCGEAASNYMQTVDHLLESQFGKAEPFHAYLYTTYLVEQRANACYPIYDTVAQAAGKPTLFRGILEEERRHLEEITVWLQHKKETDAYLTQLKALEEQAFEVFLAAMKKAVAVEGHIYAEI